jgi:hypothetical protein
MGSRDKSARLAATVVVPAPAALGQQYELECAARIAQNKLMLSTLVPAKNDANLPQAKPATKRARAPAAAGKENDSHSPKQIRTSVRHLQDQQKKLEQQAAQTKALTAIAPLLEIVNVPRPTGPPAALARYGHQAQAAVAAKVKLEYAADASAPATITEHLLNKMGAVMGQHIYDSCCFDTMGDLKDFWMKTNADSIAHDRIILLMKKAPDEAYTLRCESAWFDKLFGETAVELLVYCMA